MNKIGYTAFSEKVYKIMPALKLSVFSCFVRNQQTFDRDTGKINRCRIAVSYYAVFWHRQCVPVMIQGNAQV